MLQNIFEKEQLFTSTDFSYQVFIFSKLQPIPNLKSTDHLLKHSLNSK